MTHAYDVTGDLRQCPTCRAPFVSPFPVDWTLELIKEGQHDKPVHSYITPHRPECTAPPADPQPGIACRISGAFVVEAEVGIPDVFPRNGRYRCDCGRFFASPSDLLIHRNNALATLAQVTERPRET